MDENNLKLMLGIWDDYANNPEYTTLREKYKGLSGSQFDFRNTNWTNVKNEKLFTNI